MLTSATVINENMGMSLVLQIVGCKLRVRVRVSSGQSQMSQCWWQSGNKLNWQASSSGH